MLISEINIFPERKSLTIISFPVTVADYADADPAIVKSGRVKKAVANAVEKEGKYFIMYKSDNSVNYSLRSHCLLPCVEKVLIFNNMFQ